MLFNNNLPLSLQLGTHSDPVSVGLTLHTIGLGAVLLSLVIRDALHGPVSGLSTLVTGYLGLKHSNKKTSWSDQISITSLSWSQSLALCPALPHRPHTCL